MTNDKNINSTDKHMDGLQEGAAMHEIMTILAESSSPEAQAMLKAAAQVRAEQCRQELKEKNESAIGDLNIIIERQSIDLDAADRCIENLHWVRGFSTDDRKASYELDSIVLNLASKLIARKELAISNKLRALVRDSLWTYGQGSGEWNALRRRLAILDYASCHVAYDEKAQAEAADAKNVNIQYSAVHNKIVAAVNDQSLLQEAVDAARLEVHRQVWCRVLLQGENDMFLKNACDQLAVALLATSEVNPKLMELIVILDTTIRRGY